MADQLNKPVQPLSKKQMIHAKKRWPRNIQYVTHKLDDYSWSLDELITKLENIIPDQYRKEARITVERDRDDGYSPWLDIWYHQDETVEGWEERVTIAFRLDQHNQKEYKKNQDDKDLKEYARLKAKFEKK